MFILVILNTIMIGWILCNQVRLEADRVGGKANYKMVQKIYKSEAFKQQQAQQIEQALQMYQGGGAATTQQVAPTTETAEMPTVTPTVAQ